MEKEEKNTAENRIIFKKMEHFLVQVTDADKVARNLQRLITMIALTVIRNDNKKNPIDMEFLDEGIYDLSQLIEILQSEKKVV